ncbi:MAG: TatD family hydrolase [Chloroflexi bacterium]|nr:TatD family hydrolase [Chloroflexota bacterium]
MYKLIDTHAHLEEIEDLEAALDRAKAAGVVAIVAVGMDYESNQKALELSAKYDSFIYPALGLHPWELGSMGSEEVQHLLRFIEENIARSVAVGEIGLDYDKRVIKVASKDRQKEVFKDVLMLARKYNKPALIHSRYSWKDALTLTQEAGVKQAVFHWYAGPSSVLREIVAQGYFISATPAAQYHEEHRRAVREAPLDHLLLETDCPVEYGRETRYKSEPADILRSLKAAAELKGLEEGIVAEETTKNALKFFGLA